MPITPSQIIEAVIDELVAGDIAADLDHVAVQRLGPGLLELDYGVAGKFTVEVKPV